MATMPIDFSLLSRDELEEELLVRSIVGKGVEAIRKLNNMVTQEQTGERVNPLPLPTTRLNQEMADCREKFDALCRSVQEAVDAGKDVADSASVVRLWHLESKVARLLAAYPGTDAVLSLQKEIQGLISKLSTLASESVGEETVVPNINASASAQSEFRGFDSPTANVVNDFITNSMRVGRAKTAKRGGPNTRYTFRPEYPPGAGETNTAVPVTFAQQEPYGAAQAGRAAAGNEGAHIPVYGQPHRFNLGHTMSRWPVRYPGTSNIPIDEFIFRVENLAAADNIPLPSLMIGLHFLLEKGPSDFYWNYLRKNNAATWDQIKAALLERYATLDSDVEIRKAIADRRQMPGEEFGEFSLAIENLANRLRRPMDEGEIIEYLRQNMSHRLQTALMLHPTYTIRELQAHSRRFEKLWEVQSHSSRRPAGRVNELEEPFNNLQLYDAVPGHPALAGNELAAYAPNTLRYEPSGVVEALRSRQTTAPGASNPNRGDYVVCWNCLEMGHTFVDCVAARTVFCYGCGAKNTYKPQCVGCNAGNARRAGVIAGTSRPNPFTLPKKDDNPQ